MNILNVKDLSYKYNKKNKALNNISFDVKDGLIGVLGPNGAGKTTLMKVITTLYEVQCGEVKLNNIDYKKDIKEIRKEIGYLPQDFNVYGNLTGREFLKIIATIKLENNKNLIEEEINRIIDELDLGKYVDNKIKTYSGGMKQKIGFAQVLIGKPKVIVVDEPTVGLDPEQRYMVRQLFPKISKDSIVFVTTHIVEDIEYYCDYLIIIDEGEIIYSGSKDNFMKETSGYVWIVNDTEENFRNIRQKGEILHTVQENGQTMLKYISNGKIMEHAIEVRANLQDSYIVFQKLYRGKLNG